MKILTFHGLGGQEKNPQSWQPQWDAAFTQALRRWGGHAPQVVHGEYDDVFGKTPMTAGGTAQGFGRLLWDEIRYSFTDTISNLWPFRRRAFGDRVNETLKWKVGMVTQFAEDAKLRARLRDHLAEQIKRHNPDVVFAHSLGTLLTYNLLLNKPYTALLRDRVYITAGCQIGRAALRTLFGGRLTTVDAGVWFNLYNRHDDVLVVPLNISAPNYRQVDTHFDVQGIGDHDAIGYILHENAVNSVWRKIGSRSRALEGAPGRAEKPAFELTDMAMPAGPRMARQQRRALLIGINDYPNPEDRLEGCVNDVFRMSAALQQIGFEPEDIRVVLDDRATAAGIRERFGWLMADPQPGDVRVLFFSGHGTQIPDYGSDETVDHKDESLVPFDFDWDDRSTHLTDDDFNSVYAQLPYETTFVAFFDCCHSGGIARLGGARVRGINPPDDIRHRMLRWDWENQIWRPRDLNERRAARKIETYMENREEYVGVEKDKNRLFRAMELRQIDDETYEERKKKFGHKGPYQPLIFEACGEKQLAYEYRDGVTSYGAYTYFLTQELFAAAREGRESTFQQLHLRAQKLVGECFEQTPRLIGPAPLRNAKVPQRERARRRTSPAKRKPRAK
jgi:hypothetical protein